MPVGGPNTTQQGGIATSQGDGTDRYTFERQPRLVVPVASDANPTIDTDYMDDVVINPLSTNVASFTTNLTGTLVEEQTLIIKLFADSGGPYTLAWGAAFASSLVTLPLTIPVSSKLRLGFIYDAGTATLDLVALA